MRSAARATRSSSIAFILPLFYYRPIIQLEAFGCLTCSRPAASLSWDPQASVLDVSSSFTGKGEAAPLLFTKQ